jgi:hypothetical protein
VDKKLAESIALFKHQIISPVLMDSTAEQMAYFRQKSEKEFDIPGRGLRRYTASTMKNWLYNYRRRGFQALMPKCRTDIGGFRTLAPDAREKTKILRQEHLHESCTRFYDRCIRERTLGDPPVCIETLRRFLKLEGHYKISPAIQARKRFEMRYFGELGASPNRHDRRNALHRAITRPLAIRRQSLSEILTTQKNNFFHLKPKLADDKLGFFVSITNIASKKIRPLKRRLQSCETRCSDTTFRTKKSRTKAKSVLRISLSEVPQF